MSILNTAPPLPALDNEGEIQAFAHKLAQAIVLELSGGPLSSPFIRSSDCAQLMGVTPEHLCAMRARVQGPPWSGEGKWVRYERVSVLEWMRNLPRQTPSTSSTSSPPTSK